MTIFVPAAVVSITMRRELRERMRRNKRKHQPAKWKPRRAQRTRRTGRATTS